MAIAKYEHLYIIFLIIFKATNADWNTKDYMKREHSLIKPFQIAGLDIPFWDFTGHTIVTNDYIRLTPDKQSMAGMLWNSKPIHVRNWDLQVHFKVHGKGKDSLFGDGLAIWYSRDRIKEGPVFGSKDFFSGLAVFLDTYSNHNGPHSHQHPYISAMINNGSMSYDHDRDGTHTQLAGCEAKFRNLNHDTHISIKYENDVLTVSTDIENKAAWKECFSVSGVQLPTGYYLGFSATTGDLSDNHDILSVRLFELDLPNESQGQEDRSKLMPSATHFEPQRDHVEDPKPSSLGGFKLFLLLLVGTLAIVACIVIGIMFYQQQQQTRKRLY